MDTQAPKMLHQDQRPDPVLPNFPSKTCIILIGMAGAALYMLGLAGMEQMEQEGTRFVNIKKKDTMSRYLGPLGAALIFIAFMAGIIALLVWAFTVDPAEAPPLPVIIAFIAIPAAVIIGVLVALVQRFKQIKGGEEDAASQY